MRALSPWERVIGGEVPVRLRPLMAMVGLSVMAQYLVLAFVAIYAVRELDVSDASVGAGLAIAAAAGLAAGPLGGRLSDRHGRRRVISAGLALQTTGSLALCALPAEPLLLFASFALVNAGMGARWASQQALVADLVGGSGREGAFAVMRTTFNVGAALGPVVGAGLLLVGWEAVFGAAALLCAGAWQLSGSLPDPRRSDADGDGDQTGGAESSGGASLKLLLERRLMIGLLAAVLGWTVYNGFELLLPVSLTETHGYAPSAWGLLFVVNPLIVVVGQVRIVAWTAGWARATRLVVALLLMGASFLLIPAGAGVPLVVLCLIGFTLGEMLWGPASQSLIADLAPQGLRGTAMGVLGSTTTAGVALAGGAGLAIYETAGDAAMWLAVAACAVVSAALYAIASHGRSALHAAGSLHPASDRSRESEPWPADRDEDGDGRVLVEASTKERE